MAYGLGEGSETVAEATAAVEAALQQVRPLVESHGGALEVVSVVDGVVSVRMKGTCDGCPSSSLEQVDPAEEIDLSKADLTCVTVPEAAAAPEPQAVLLQIRGHELR